MAALNLPPEREAEIIEEISQHLQERFDELLATGTSEHEARDLVLADLQGDRLLARELRNVEPITPLNALLTRTSDEESRVIAASREVFRQLDPHLPIFDVQTMSRHVRSALLPALVAACMLGSFGALSLVLAATGIFGVTSYTVSQRRTHEIGVRIALGAQPGDVVSLLLREGMKSVLLGITLGLAGAVALARMLSTQLTGVSTGDVTTFAGVSMELIAVSLVACWLPANRATRIDPMEALHYE